MTRGPWNHSSSRTVLRACILSSGAPSTFAQDLFHANFFGLAGLPGNRSSLALFRTGSGSLGVLAVLHPGGNVCHLLVGGSLGTLDDRVRNLGGEQPDGTKSVSGRRFRFLMPARLACRCLRSRSSFTTSFFGSSS